MVLSQRLIRLWRKIRPLAMARAGGATTELVQSNGGTNSRSSRRIVGTIGSMLKNY
ncbi:MAG: hypothetical protein V1668_04485 [Patescibacteria group bacterium]